MSIIRNRVKSKYSQIPNELLTDNRISYGARIVMCYLLSKPDEWIVNNKDIKKQLDIGQDHTIAKYWRELMDTGWVFRERNKNPKGQFDDYIYTLHTSKPKQIQDTYRDEDEDLTVEKPQLGNDSLIVGLPHVVTPILGKTHSLNKTDIKNNNTEKNNTNCGIPIPLVGEGDIKIPLKKKENNNAIQVYDYWESKLNKQYDRTSDTYKARIQTIKRALSKYDYQTIINVIEYKITNPLTQNRELSSILGNYLPQNIENMSKWLETNKQHTQSSINKPTDEHRSIHHFDY